MTASSYMQQLYGRPRPAAQNPRWMGFWPQYRLSPVSQHAEPPVGQPPLIEGTNMPAMPLGQLFAELPSAVAKQYIDTLWPHLQPHVREEARAAADEATIRAAFMAGGVALVVLFTSYWIKKG